MSCGVGHKYDSDLVLLWLWYRPAVAALIWPLAWEPLALKRQKKKKNMMISVVWGCGEIDILIHCLWECQMVQLLWVTVWQLFKMSKHIVTIWSSNSAPRYIPKRNENIPLHKNWYMNVHCNSIHNSPKVETISHSFPKAAVSNHYKRGGWKQQKFIVS